MLGTLDDLTWELLERHIEVDLRGAFNATRAVASTCLAACALAPDVGSLSRIEESHGPDRSLDLPGLGLVTIAALGFA